MTRRKLTAAEKYAIWQRQDWLCGCGCGESIADRSVHYDHRLPLWAGGADDPSNLDALLPDHHGIKTQIEASKRAKADRAGRKHRGEWRAPKKRIQSRGFDKRLRKKLNGEVVRRGTT